MKKTVFVILFCLLGFGGLQAQKVALGLKTGVNLASIGGDAAETFASRTGFHIGAFAGLKFGKIGLQPELLFSLQGAQGEDDSNIKINTSYVNVPILLKVYIIKGLNVQLGPQFGVLLDVNQEGGLAIDFEEAYRGADISGCFGAGLELGKVNIMARYTLGLNDITQEDVIVGFEEYRANNQVFQLSIGYSFL